MPRKWLRKWLRSRLLPPNPSKDHARAETKHHCVHCVKIMACSYPSFTVGRLKKKKKEEEEEEEEEEDGENRSLADFHASLVY